MDPSFGAPPEDAARAPSSPPLPTAERIRRAVGVVAGLVVTAVLVAGFVVHVPYVIISPGSAVKLDEGVVSVSGTTSYGQSGNLLFLTVLESTREPSLWRWLLAEIDGDVEVFEREQILGCSSYEEDTLLNQTLMTDSQDSARLAAFRHLGLGATPGASRVVVLGVDCTSDALHKLRPGDVVTAIDRAPVSRVDDIAPVLAAHRPGDVVSVTVSRPEGPATVSVELGKRAGAPRLGVFVQTAADWQFATDVRIDASLVGGPSAGLAFVLAIVDELTPGDLTRGRRIAVTGTIAADGTVGDVGGVAQKAVVAKRSGVALLLVPRREVREARAHAGDVRVVGVRTLDEALTAIERRR